MNAPTTTRTRALAKLRELPTWPDIVVLLDGMIGAHPERTELEMLMTLLVLQATDIGQQRVLDRVNPLIAELRGLIAAANPGVRVAVENEAITQVPIIQPSPV